MQIFAQALPAGTFAYTPVSGTVLSTGDAQSLSVTFTPADTVNLNPANASVKINVKKADQTISFGALVDKTYGDAAFTVSATSDSELTVSFAVTNNCTISGNTVSITGAGSCTVTASQAGDSNYNPATDVSQTFTINPAPVTASITGRPFNYDGNPHAADIVLNPQISGYSVNYAGTSTAYNSSNAPTHADTYTVTVTITDSNYVLSGSGAGSITINKADPVVTATGGTFTYDGNPHAGSETATGVLTETLTPVNVAYKDSVGNLLTSAPVDAGTYSVAVRFAGNADYNPKQSAAVPLIIKKATADIVVTPYNVVYDGNTHTATGTATAWAELTSVPD